MIGHLRIHNIRQALVDVVNSGVPGHFAELGVWRGEVQINVMLQ